MKGSSSLKNIRMQGWAATCFVNWVVASAIAASGCGTVSELRDPVDRDTDAAYEDMRPKVPDSPAGTCWKAIETQAWTGTGCYSGAPPNELKACRQKETMRLWKDRGGACVEKTERSRAISENPNSPSAICERILTTVGRNAVALHGRECEQIAARHLGRGKAPEEERDRARTLACEELRLNPPLDLSPYERGLECPTGDKEKDERTEKRRQASAQRWHTMANEETVKRAEREGKKTEELCDAGKCTVVIEGDWRFYLAQELHRQNPEAPKTVGGANE